MDRTENISQIFAKILLLARKWEVIVNRAYPSREDITVKQLLLLIIVENSFSTPPSVMEVAKALATSHQNVKAIASNLHEKGFIQLYNDPDDKRTVRIRLNSEKSSYWEKRNEKDIELLSDFFSNIDDNEVSDLASLIDTLDNKARDLIGFS